MDNVPQNTLDMAKIMEQLNAALKDLEMIGDCRTCGNLNSFCADNPDACHGYKWRGPTPLA